MVGSALPTSAPRRVPQPKMRGQTLVEFALILPIFLLLLFGLIDMGRFVYMHTTLSQATREAARLVSTEASWVGSTDLSCNTFGGPVCPADLNALKAHALDAANRMMEPFSSIAAADLYLSCDVASTPPTGNWITQTCTSKSSGNLASVRVVYDLPMITPVLNQFLPTVSSEASATMVIN